MTRLRGEALAASSAVALSEKPNTGMGPWR